MPLPEGREVPGFATYASAKIGENVNPIFGQLALEVVRRFAMPAPV